MSSALETFVGRLFEMQPLGWSIAVSQDGPLSPYRVEFCGWSWQTTYFVTPECVYSARSPKGLADALINVVQGRVHDLYDRD